MILKHTKQHKMKVDLNLCKNQKLKWGDFPCNYICVGVKWNEKFFERLGMIEELEIALIVTVLCDVNDNNIYKKKAKLIQTYVRSYKLNHLFETH